MSNISLILFLTVTWFLIATSFCIAQDAHYWTEQFGNRSTLLSGAVIGSVDDLGVVFYNPARLAIQEEAAFLISAKAYQQVTLKVKDGLGGKEDLSNQRLGPAPTLVAGSFNLKKVKKLKALHKHKFAYAFMSRYNFDYNFGGRTFQRYEYNLLWDGEEDLYASVSWDKSFKEEWIGVAWAMPISDKWSIGLTNFLTTTSQSTIFDLELQGLGAENSLAVSTKKRSADFTALGYVAKLGVSYAVERMSLGLTVTSPKAHIAGSGNTNYEEIFAGIADISPNILESGQSTNATTRTKSPLSVGLGAGIKFGSNILHLSAEWFDHVDEYYVLVPEPFTGQTTNELIRNRSIDERKSVINYGVGIEWKLKDNVKAYTSASTDFSSLVLHSDEVLERVTDRTDNSIMTSDIYHFGSGLSLSLKKLDLTLGTVYSRGKQRINQPVRFPSATDDNGMPIVAQVEQADLIWERWRVLIGFSLPFASFGGAEKKKAEEPN